MNEELEVVRCELDRIWDVLYARIQQADRQGGRDRIVQADLDASKLIDQALTLVGRAQQTLTKRGQA
jgi:hypothetical protein